MQTPILGTFFLASAGEIQEGADWYINANKIANAIASRLNLSIKKVAGVIAAISPQNPWERNIINAEQLCTLFVAGGYESAKQYKVGTFNANKEKALAILQSDNDDAIESILNGNKVTAFYHCILLQDGVCVDGHAYSIWLGNRVATTKTPKISNKLYQQIADDYREATEIINRIMNANYRPFQIQAITWVVHRNLYN